MLQLFTIVDLSPEYENIILFCAAKPLYTVLYTLVTLQIAHKAQPKFGICSLLLPRIFRQVHNCSCSLAMPLLIFGMIRADVQFISTYSTKNRLYVRLFTVRFSIAFEIVHFLSSFLVALLISERYS